ncbi:MAG TPA: radical SAM protein [Deltaproteobacteria bacterium]|nr:radical SAM protein [Deltaproteobacteria bacterium]
MSLADRAVFFGRVIKSRLTGARAPLVVVLNVINRCNLRCIYCYGEYYDRKVADFTTGELKDLIDELAAMGTKSITIGGGEPLLRGDIGEIIAHVKSRRIECGMNTNGTLIPKKIDAVSQLDSVCVSLDGDEVPNDLNRGDGTYRRIVEGIKAARAAGVHVHTNTVLTRNSIGSIDHIMRLARKLGFMTEFNLPFYLGERDSKNDELYPDDEQCRRAWRKILDYKARGYPVLFSRASHLYALRWPDYRRRVYYDEDPDFDYIRCYAGRLMCFIDSDGSVYPCAQLIGTFEARNIRDEGGFAAAWEHLASNPCRTCYFTCFNHFNLIFRLDASTIAETVKNTFREAL